MALRIFSLSLSLCRVDVECRALSAPPLSIVGLARNATVRRPSAPLVSATVRGGGGDPCGVHRQGQRRCVGKQVRSSEHTHIYTYERIKLGGQRLESGVMGVGGTNPHGLCIFRVFRWLPRYCKHIANEQNGIVDQKQAPTQVASQSCSGRCRLQGGRALLYRRRSRATTRPPPSR